MYVLTCGHMLCADDLAALGLRSEDRPALFHRCMRAAFAHVRWLVHRLLPWFATLFVLYLSTDPGAPAQWMFTAVRALDDAALARFRLVSSRYDVLCASVCYATTETRHHDCNDDCDCDGARTCSFFGFCVSASGDCDAEATEAVRGTDVWTLAASAPLVRRHLSGSSSDSPTYAPENVTLYVDKSDFRREAGDGGGDHSAASFISPWSAPFTLHTVDGLSMRLRVVAPASGMNGMRRSAHRQTPAHSDQQIMGHDASEAEAHPHAHPPPPVQVLVDVRGPEGYFLDLQVDCLLSGRGASHPPAPSCTHKAGEPRTYPLTPSHRLHTEPAGGGEWLVGSLQFLTDSPVLECVVGDENYDGLGGDGDGGGSGEGSDGRGGDGSRVHHCLALGLTIHVNEVRYLPTFYSYHGNSEMSADGAPNEHHGSAHGPDLLIRMANAFLAHGTAVHSTRLWSGILRRGSSLAAHCELAGSGRLKVRIFPAGADDASEGRGSLLLTGPPGLQLTYLVRYREEVLGTLDDPLRCHDAGTGCWLKDAGSAAEHSITKGRSYQPDNEPSLVAISLLSAAIRTWGSASCDANMRERDCLS